MADHPQPAPGRNRRVLLAQRARRAVAGIGERRLAFLHQAGIERLEVGQPEEHLAADLEHGRDRILGACSEPVRDVVDGAGVERHVLSGAAVTPRGRPFQAPVAVHQRQCDAVDLELAQEVRIVGTLRPQLGPQSRCPRRQFVGVEDVVQAEHALQVLSRREIGRKSRAADKLGRRIGNPQLGVVLFEGGQPPQQHIELRVGDDRRIPHVITELMLADFVGQLMPAPAQVRVGGGGFDAVGVRVGWAHSGEAIEAHRHRGAAVYAGGDAPSDHVQ